MGGFQMQYYRNLHVIWSLLRSPMATMTVNWLKTVWSIMITISKYIAVTFIMLFINYGWIRTITNNETDTEKFIINIVMIVVFIIEVMFVCAINGLVQYDDIQAAKAYFKAYFKAIYFNAKRAYFESRTKLVKDMREFDIEAQMLVNKDN